MGCLYCSAPVKLSSAVYTCYCSAKGLFKGPELCIVEGLNTTLSQTLSPAQHPKGVLL